MPDKEFNLLHEPWILVMKQDGTTEEVSILDAFRHAHEFRAISGELPTQDVAILRLLLAIMHAVFGRVDVDGEKSFLCEGDVDLAFDRWESLWELGKLPMNPIESYLNQYEERFWLFHPETPFYQVAEMAKSSTGSEYTASKLNGVLSESGNKTKWFSPLAGKAKESLTYPEAARWLLHLNAFDDTSAKPTRGQNLPSVGAGWLGKLGLVYASGNSLFETLMLNFILLKDGKNEVCGEEKPVWERPVKGDERTPVALPDNFSDLYTLQSRRLILYRSGNHVTGYKLLGGDFFDKENAFIEPMTVWRNNKKKEADPNTFTPRRHDAERQVWRDFEAMLVRSEGKQRPTIVDWIASLQSEDCLKSKDLISFKTPGVSYADKDFFVEDIIDDTLTIHTHLVTQMSDAWIKRIVNEISVCDQLVYQLGILAKNIQLAAGAGKEDKQPDGAKANAMKSGYDALDNPFRIWLESITQDDDIDNKCEEWWEIAKTKIRKLGELLINQAGPKAFIGHSEGMTSSEAYNIFLYKTSSRDALTQSNAQKSKGGKK